MPRSVNNQSFSGPSGGISGKILLLVAMALLAGLALAACDQRKEGGSGEPESGGEHGPGAESGLTSVSAVTVLPVGNESCPFGGQEIEYGIDDNGNGSLDADEVGGTVIICNGEDGAPGSPGNSGRAGSGGDDSLITIVDEPSGVNCSYGGQRIDVGLDDGSPAGTAGDGILQAGEIDDTNYVCATGNGANEGTAAVPVILTLDSAHEATVAGGGTSYYKFTATATVGGIIVTYKVESDLSWTLYSDAFATSILTCDNNGEGKDESCRVNLTSGTTYFLSVTEKRNMPELFGIGIFNMDFLAGADWSYSTTIYRISTSDGSLVPLRGVSGITVSSMSWYPPTDSLIIGAGGLVGCNGCLYQTGIVGGAMEPSGISAYAIPGMALRHSDNMIFYQSNNSYEIFSFNPADGANTLIYSNNLYSGLGMIFDGSGALYQIEYSDLYMINPATGTPTWVSPITESGNIGSDYTSMAIRPSDGKIFVSSNLPALGTLDVCTGVVTEVAQFPFEIEGLAWVGSGTPPPPPLCANLTAGLGGSGAISVNWWGYPNADSYNIYWGTAAGINPADSGTYTTVVNDVSGTNAYIHTGTPATTYYYRVTAVTGGADSIPSVEASMVSP